MTKAHGGDLVVSRDVASVSDDVALSLRPREVGSCHRSAEGFAALWISTSTSFQSDSVIGAAGPLSTPSLIWLASSSQALSPDSARWTAVSFEVATTPRIADRALRRPEFKQLSPAAG